MIIFASIFFFLIFNLLVVQYAIAAEAVVPVLPVDDQVEFESSFIKQP